MTPTRLILSVSFLAFMLAQTCQAQSWHTDLKEARQEAARLNRPLLCHFGADWCAPCLKMERTVLNQPAVLSQFKDKVVAVKIDVVKNPELAKRFGVEALPTDVMIDLSGKRILDSSGYKSVDDYVSFISRGSERFATQLAQQEPSQSPPVAATETPTAKPAQPKNNIDSAVMLNSYCPVKLHGSRQWVKGSKEFEVEFKGQKFHCSSLENKLAFMKNAEKFSPQFLGCDPVLIYTADRAVPGTVEFAAYYDGKLYLFANKENRQSFKSAPEKYIRTQVVLKINEIESLLK